MNSTLYEPITIIVILIIIVAFDENSSEEKDTIFNQWHGPGIYVRK